MDEKNAAIVDGELVLCEAHELEKVFGFNISTDSAITRVWIDDDMMLRCEVKAL